MMSAERASRWEEIGRRKRKRVAVSIRKGRLCFVRLPDLEIDSAVLDELPAKPAFDAELPPGGVVAEG